MNKNEFLNRLGAALASLPEADRNDILQDFAEHFSAGLETGKTEEQICAELGSPEVCARQYIPGTDAGYTQNTANTVNAKPAQAYSYGSAPAYGRQTQTDGAPFRPGMTVQNTADRRSKTIWSIVFILFVLAAFAVYPVAAGLMISPVAILLGTVFAAEFAVSTGMIIFLISLAVALFSAGLLMFLIMTALLKLSFRRSSF
ncbi:MAG: DUF1700 domain-containing protein [Ruminococcaceae bacterium]|nr:DUF1700 domain-containing protein [Oscillospiraceae bacterium]